MRLFVRSTVQAAIVAVLVQLLAVLAPGDGRAAGDVSEQRIVGRWSVVAVGDDTGVICMIGRSNRQKMMLNVMTPSQVRVLAFVLDGREIGWQLKPGAEYDVTFVVDDKTPVAAKGHVQDETTIAIPFALDFPETEPLRHGRAIEFRAARGSFWFDLEGSSAALDALADCAERYRGVGAKSANPFKGAPSSQSLTTGRGSDAAPEPAGDVESEIDATIAIAKQLRMTRVIFSHDPWAEDALRHELRLALTSGPANLQTNEVTQAVVQAFLARQVDKAMKAAPPDALAKVIRHDRDVLREFRARPEICAAYFRATGTGDFSFLPTEQRLELGEMFADLIEAAMLRPDHSSDPVSDEQIAAWMGKAYADQGYNVEDLTRLADVGSLDDGELCRLGYQFMSALSTLSDTQASRLYRAMAP